MKAKGTAAPSKKRFAPRSLLLWMAKNLWHGIRELATSALLAPRRVAEADRKSGAERLRQVLGNGEYLLTVYGSDRRVQQKNLIFTLACSRNGTQKLQRFSLAKPHIYRTRDKPRAHRDPSFNHSSTISRAEPRSSISPMEIAKSLARSNWFVGGLGCSPCSYPTIA